MNVPIKYKGHKLANDLRLDILVEDKVIIELKSVQELQNVFYKQTLTYLRLTGLKLGILVNFNTDMINDNIKRIVN